MGGEGPAPGLDLLSLLGAHSWTAPLEAVGEHGDGAEEEETEAKAVDLAVEMPPEEWAPIEGRGGPAAITFVDGMRRVEVGLAAWAGERPIWALAGAVAAGAVRCRPPERAQVVAEAMERVLVVGLEGCREEELVVPAGSNSLRYRVVAAGGGGQRQVAFALLGHMRSLEAQVARSLSPAPGEALVVDGPLPFRPRQLPAGDAVGLVKEHRRLYLPHPNALACLHSLRPGERTPLFLLEGERPPARRLSWYACLAPRELSLHALSGIVRLEVWADVGRERAVHIADAITAALPQMASPPYYDRRAPANIVPIVSLEGHLRRSLGDRERLRRLLLDAIISRRRQRVGEE